MKAITIFTAVALTVALSACEKPENKAMKEFTNNGKMTPLPEMKKDPAADKAMKEFTNNGQLTPLPKPKQ